MQQDINFLRAAHFTQCPVRYEQAWIFPNSERGEVLSDICVLKNDADSDNSWSLELEGLHEEPMREGWLEVYEREQVTKALAPHLAQTAPGGRVLEFGASFGYMIEQLKGKYPQLQYIAADLERHGLNSSYRRNPDVLHVQCDLTDAPFEDGTIDILYALNVLEHIADDESVIGECYRMLKPGGYCLFVVPRGEKLYDYFDETLYHKRRYAKGELCKKAFKCGFIQAEDFHLVWSGYPLFCLKKKMNQAAGKRMTAQQKMEHVEADIKGAEAMSLALRVMHIESALSKVIHPGFGIREVLLLRKPTVSSSES